MYQVTIFQMLRGLTVLIDADISRFQTAIASVSGGLSGFAAKAQQVGSILTATISVPLGLVGKKAVETFSDMDSLRRGLATLEKDSSSLRNRLTELVAVSRLPGLGLREALQFDVSLRSAGLSADMSKKSMIAFGNALATVGKGKNELKGVSLQLQQLATKNGGFGADLRIIKEYAPQVQNALGKAFGTVDTDAIAKMGVTGKQVIEKLVAELDKLPRATGGAKNAFENFSDVTTNALDGLGATIYKGLRFEAFFSSLGDSITTLVSKFVNLPATTQSLVAAFGALAVVLPPLIAAIGFFTTTVLPALKAGLIVVRAAAVLALGPWGLIAVAVAAAAAVIIANWDKIKGFLVNTGVWTQLKDIVKSSLGFVTSIFAAFANLFQGDWSNLMEHIKNIVKYGWNAIVAGVGTAILAMGGAIGKLLSVIGLDKWSKTVDEEMKRVEKRLASHKWNIQAPAFNLFDKFQYGGQTETEIAGRPVKGKKGKAEKSEKPITELERLEEKAKALTEFIQDNRAFGITTDSAIHELDLLESQIKRIKGEAEKPTTLNPLNSNIGNIDATIPRQTRLSKPLYEGTADAPKLPGVDNLTSQIKENAKLIADAYTAMRDSIKGAATSTAQEMASGLGEVVGGIATGQISMLSGLITIATDFLSAYLSKLAQINLMTGAALIAAGAATLQPYLVIQGKQKLTAGLGLQVASGAVKAVGSALQTKAFEKGGLITGPTMALMGESYKARSGGGEYVASVDLGSKLIAQNIIKMGAIGSNTGQVNRLQPYMGGSGMPLDLRLSGEVRQSGGDLLYAIRRAERTNGATGTRS